MYFVTKRYKRKTEKTFGGYSRQRINTGFSAPSLNISINKSHLFCSTTTITGELFGGLFIVSLHRTKPAHGTQHYCYHLKFDPPIRIFSTLPSLIYQPIIYSTAIGCMVKWSTRYCCSEVRPLMNRFPGSNPYSCHPVMANLGSRRAVDGNSVADTRVVERERGLGVGVDVERVKAIRRVVGGFHACFLVIASCTCIACSGTRF